MKLLLGAVAAVYGKIPPRGDTKWIAVEVSQHPRRVGCGIFQTVRRARQHRSDRHIGRRCRKNWGCRAGVNGERRRQAIGDIWRDGDHRAISRSGSRANSIAAGRLVGRDGIGRRNTAGDERAGDVIPVLGEPCHHSAATGVDPRWRHPSSPVDGGIDRAVVAGRFRPLPNGSASRRRNKAECQDDEVFRNAPHHITRKR